MFSVSVSDITHLVSVGQQHNVTRTKQPRDIAKNLTKLSTSTLSLRVVVLFFPRSRTFNIPYIPVMSSSKYSHHPRFQF